jgi:hypothetical protein
VLDRDIALRPSEETNTRLLDAYLQHLSDAAQDTSKLLVDIKYGHVHNFEQGWWPSEWRPFLLMYLEKREIKIIHLTRRDSLAAVVSGHVADNRRVWHKMAGEPAPLLPKARIGAMRAVNEALALEREKEKFFAWLRPNTCFPMTYEELADSDASRHDVMIRLCNFLEIRIPAEFRSVYLRVTPSLPEAVENYDELVQASHELGGRRLKIERC